MKRINQPVSPFLDDELFADPESYVARPTQSGLHEPDDKDELEFEGWEWEENDGESEDNGSNDGLENALQEFDVYTSDNELDSESEGFEQHAWAEQFYREADADLEFLADEDDEFAHREDEHPNDENTITEETMLAQELANELDIPETEEYFEIDGFDNTEEEDEWLNGDRVTLNGYDEAELDFEADRFESLYAYEQSHLESPRPMVPTRVPAHLPKSAPVPFAREPAVGSFWPVKSSSNRGREVAFLATDGTDVGNRSRRFMAKRKSKNKKTGKRFYRHHVGIDLYANHGDAIVACEAGRIVNFHNFAGKTKALLVEHDDIVINYGEVAADSLKRAGLRRGSSVAAGQTIGFVGKLPNGSSMVHFEIYEKGTNSTQRWMWNRAAPKAIRNPTKYLLYLQEHGKVGRGQLIHQPAGAGTEPSDVEWRKAILENRKWSTRLGWEQHRVDIGKLLGFTDFSPDERTFAEAISHWQQNQRLESDGIVGPKTWQALRKAISISQTGAILSSSNSDSLSSIDNQLGTLEFQRNGKIVFRYKFTPKDLVWTTRMIIGESGGKDDLENRAVIAAMLNRYALFTHRKYPSFHEFIRAYSTPLQPAFRSRKLTKRRMNEPDFVKTGGTFAGGNIPRGQMKKHLDLQQRGFDQLRASARMIALEALSGKMAETGIGLASDFASTWIIYGRKHGKANRTEARWMEFTENYKQSKGGRWIGRIPNLNQKRNAFFLDKGVKAADSVRIVRFT